MAVVVRCPACRSIAEVEAAAQGLTVRCPRCEDLFVAVPEAEMVVQVRPKRNSATVRRRSREVAEGSSQSAPMDRVRHTPEFDHDPHRHPVGGLPATVVVGLALLPYLIPILWVTVPAIWGKPPLLSVGVPLAIAISASTLSLAVIYTIDWSSSLRLKGVLMLLGLSYFVSLSFYFLNEKVVQQIKAQFSGSWTRFAPLMGGQNYEVMLPEQPIEQPRLQPIPEIEMHCYSHVDDDKLNGVTVFAVGSGDFTDENGPGPEDEKWFVKTSESIVKASNGELDLSLGIENLKGPQNSSGRQFRIKLPDSEMYRIVRLFAIEKKVYYLAIEGREMSVDDERVKKFFRSFKLIAAH
jgi:phage FluMu protein Com